MKRVLLTTPISAIGGDANYIRSLLATLTARLPGISLDYAACGGGSVNFARNDGAFEAECGNFDELAKVDSDMMYKPDNLARLIAHDVDFVGGVYCKRVPGRPKWLFVPKKGAVKRPDGLLECVRIATGFQKVRVSCLRKLREVFPEREFLAQETPESPILTRMEWYPMGVRGPRTPEARMKRVKAILADKSYKNETDRVLAIETACYDAQPAGTLKGEDYFFADMMREAGFKCYVDLDMPIIPHIGDIAYPVTPENVGYGPGIENALPVAEED